MRCSCCLSPKWTESQPSVTLWNIWRTVSKLAHTPWQNSENRLYYKHGHLKNFKILKSQFYYFLKVLKKFFFKLFEFFRVRVFPKPVENLLLTLNSFKKMTLYSNFFSNAVNSVETKEKEVLITYSSNIAKEYVYNCEDVPSFTNNLCSVLISNELQQDGGSVGSFIHRSRRDEVLTEQ